MAFVSIGQKYGFVSAGDVFRKRLADAHAETQKVRDELNKAEAEKLETARALFKDGGPFGNTNPQIQSDQRPNYPITQKDEFNLVLWAFTIRAGIYRTYVLYSLSGCSAISSS